MKDRGTEGVDFLYQVDVGNHLTWIHPITYEQLSDQCFYDPYHKRNHSQALCKIEVGIFRSIYQYKKEGYDPYYWYRDYYKAIADSEEYLSYERKRKEFESK